MTGRGDERLFQVDLTTIAHAIGRTGGSPLLFSDRIPALYARARELYAEPDWFRILDDNGDAELLAEGFTDGEAQALVELLKAMLAEAKAARG